MSHGRYIRQARFAPLGEAGQSALAEASCLVVGCGALGSVLANTLARAGVGKLRIVDRDFLELSNLQRQVLYDEADVAAGLPKAIAAAAKLRAINSEIEIEAEVADVHSGNIEQLAEGVDCMVDGTDNFEIRFLLNDVALKHNIPWVYGGCIGAEGQSMTILPGETACLRCLMPEAPAPGTMPTCDTAGILGPIINVIASIQATEALKILSGHRGDISRALTVVDLWENRFHRVQLEGLKEKADCPACRGDYAWLSGARESHSAVLCGRNAVQLSFPPGEAPALAALEQKLAGVGTVTRNRFLVRLAVEDYLFTIFPDGRTIVGGTDDIAVAKSLYARYLGN